MDRRIKDKIVKLLSDNWDRNINVLDANPLFKYIDELLSGKVEDREGGDLVIKS